MLADGAALVEHEEVGDALDSKALGEGRLGVDVDLEHEGAAGGVGGDSAQLGRSGAAGAAPRGPEVDCTGSAVAWTIEWKLASSTSSGSLTGSSGVRQTPQRPWSPRCE